ncbi:MAG: GNAT family N-acetyltransferase [Aliishimia sp.]
MNVEKNIQTDRLRLSPILWTDLLFFFRLLGNDHVRKFLGGPVPLPIRLSRFKAYRRGHPKVGIWMVRNKATKKVLGMIELTPNQDDKDYEVSYQFHPTSWGSGFAREAITGVINHGLERIIAETQTANTRSCRLLEGLGFATIDTVARYGAQQRLYAIDQLVA